MTSLYLTLFKGIRMNLIPRIILVTLLFSAATPSFSKAYYMEYYPESHGELEASLLYAIVNHNLAQVRDCLKRGASANAIYNDYLRPNWTALIVAVGVGNIAIARELIAHGAQINVKTTFNGMGNPALIFAAREGHLDIAELLLAHGADIECTGHDKATPLIDAAYYGRAHVVRFLLNYGANINAQDEKGKTALMYARMYNHYETIKILLEHGATK